MTRALVLYRTFLLAAAHRLRHDLARELVALTASSVLFATFLYIFNDFLNVQVTSLSQPMRDAFAAAGAGLLAVLAGVVSGRLVKRELTAPASFVATGRALGEERGVLTAFLVLRAVTVLVFVHGLAWALIVKVLLRPSAWQAAALEGTMLVVALAAAALMRGEMRGGDASRASVSSLPSEAATAVKDGALDALFRWRLDLVTRRNRATRTAYLSALLPLLLLVLAGYRGLPVFAAFVVALGAGYLASLALVFQMADDLPNAWTERGFGVTHDQFIGAYERLGRVAGGAFGLTGFVLFFAARAAGGADAVAAALEAAKLGVVLALPSIMTPWLLLQIEGRRPGINALLILIATLFVGTAVFAHWLALLLPLLLRYYALQSQAGRFYRA